MREAAACELAAARMGTERALETGRPACGEESAFLPGKDARGGRPRCARMAACEVSSARQRGMRAVG